MGFRSGLSHIAFLILLLSRITLITTSTSGPRVAICFFGLSRSLKYTIQSIRSAIYDPLIVSNIRYDVFIHTYNATQVRPLGMRYKRDGVCCLCADLHNVPSPQISNPRSLEDHITVDWTLYKLLQPTATLIVSADEVFKTRFASTFDGLLANGDAWDEDHHSSLRNMLLQLNSLEKVYQLVQHASQEAPYNVIIASRSDLWFFNMLNASQIQEASVFPSRCMWQTSITGVASMTGLHLAVLKLWMCIAIGLKKL